MVPLDLRVSDSLMKANIPTAFGMQGYVLRFGLSDNNNA